MKVSSMYSFSLNTLSLDDVFLLTPKHCLERAILSFSSIRYSAPEMTWYENKELLWVRYKKSGDHWPRNEPSSPLLTET